jgi:putative hydrolase of the HAD superfamily
MNSFFIQSSLSHATFEIKAVLFDLDNTLHDRDLAFMAWADRFALDDLGVSGESERKEFVEALVRRDRGGDEPKLALFEWVKSLYPNASKSAETMKDEFFAHRTLFMELGDQAENLLDLLNSKSIPWGIVTNGESEQWDKLRRLKLDNATPCIMVSGEFGAHKPDTGIFLAAAENLGSHPQETLFVGDIQGAFNAGMKTCWMKRHRAWPRKMGSLAPDLSIEALSELIEIISICN